jgi:hypothetical protein
VLAALRPRITYANVIATIALFVALGGTSYAALHITSRDIANRTIKGGDVAKDTLGGTEIRERSLKQVPSAARAGTADAADTANVAKNAETATQATHATTADSATAAAAATNAQQLAGNAAGVFERSSRTQFGRASAAPANGSAESTVLAWPELGVALTNATAAHAGCGGPLALGVVNTKSAGAPAVQVFETGQGSIGSVNAAQTGYFCSDTGNDNFGIDFTDSSGRTLFVTCIASAGDLRCLGTRSEP